MLGGASTAQCSNLVRLEGGVASHDREILKLRLGDEHPVKWIAVMRGQAASSLGVIEGN